MKDFLLGGFMAAIIVASVFGTMYLKFGYF